MKSVVPVVFATDDQFAACCAVSIASMIANCDPERPYKVYIFYDVLTQENQDKLCAMGKDNVTVEMVRITQYVDRELFYVHKRQTVATYFRFFTVDALPQYDKILYLDSDIVILGDVGELYDIDIGDNLLGGVVIFRNKPSEVKVKTNYLRETFGLRPDEYFNAGILSMNLKQFRLEGTKDKCIAYLQEHRDLRWMDQDVLNGVCKGRVHFLPEKWNKSQFYVDDDLGEHGTIGDVRIIHYLDRFKPWLVHYQRCHVYFYQYALLTPYKEELTRRILENNDPVIQNQEQALRKVENLCAWGIAGPRYLFGCAMAWLHGKIQRLLKKLRKNG